MNAHETYVLNNQVTIPKLGYGTFQTPDDDSGIEAIVKAIELGYRHIDTAQSYRNEESVGQAIQQAQVSRDELFITTKIANSMSGYESTLQSLDDSLEKLGVDYIDLVLIHWPSPQRFRDQWQARNRDVWRAMEHYYEQGKIKALGISNFRSHHIEELLKTAKVKPAVNQIRICPGDVDVETIQASRNHDMLLEAYSPLAQGLVFENEDIQKLAEKYQKNTAQIVLRWSLQMGFLPLPKSVTEKRIRANMEVFDFELEADDLNLLTSMDGACGTSKDPDTVPF